MSYPAQITLPDAVEGDYWPPSTDANGRIIFGPFQFQDPDTLVQSDPTTTLDRVVAKFTRGGHVFILDSDSSNTDRDGPINITTPTGAWVFEIPHQNTFLPFAGTWDFDLSIYHGGASGPLTLYESTVTVSKDA